MLTRSILLKLCFQMLLSLCVGIMPLTVLATEATEATESRGESESSQTNAKKVKQPKANATLEIGLGAFATQLPQYLGSDQRDSYLVPLPYFYYLDENIKIDRNQFNGKLFQNNHFYLDLSASGSVKVNSEDNIARVDMPDLDWVFELGPSIKYYFTGSPQKKSFFYAEFFTRKATATDFHSITNAGWRYGPSMTYQKAFHFADLDQGKGEFEFTTRVNANFSDDRYLNYYYGVPQRYSQVNGAFNRSTYDSDGGYAGSDVSFGLTYQVNSWWFAGFARYYNLSGVVYDDSPLVKQTSQWSLGFGVAWIFYSSNTAHK